MWIRSQGKTNLVNASQVKRIRIYYLVGKTNLVNASQVKRIRIYYLVGKTSVEIHADDITLGEYSNEEKALKVLDMIQKEILKCNCVLSPINNGEVVRMLGYAEPPKVFEMPQDSEVE